MFKETLSENCYVYGIMRKNGVQPVRLQMTIYCGTKALRFACRITKVSKQTHIHNIYYLLLDN